MNRVLFKLYWMTVKGGLRVVARKFLTVRGAILSIVTLGFFGVMLAQFIFMLTIRSRVPFVLSERSALLAEYLPLGMLAYFLMGMSPALGERAIQFSASEIDFLFPAPFSRRQLLAYHLVRGFVGKIGIALLVAVSIAILVPSVLSAAVGVFCALIFLHGATIAAQLVQQTVGTQLYTRARRTILMIVLVIVGVGITWTMPTDAEPWTWLSEFRASTIIRGITAPFEAYTRLILAPRLLPQALPHLAIALAMNVVVYWFIFQLDARYEDLAVRTSQRTYERIQAVRSGNIYASPTSRTEYAYSLVPQFPWWGGAGPHMRRQLIGGSRAVRSILWVGLVIAMVSAGTIVFVVQKNPKVMDHVGSVVLGATAYMTFVLASQLPFGFRGDLDHMEVLKALPHRPIAIAFGEVVSASVICCLGQMFFVMVGILGAPTQTMILLTGALFYFPFNAILFGTNNLVLLLFPFRLSSGGADVTLMGRVMIMMLGNLLAVFLGLGIAAIPAAAVFLLSDSWPATLMIAWLGLLSVGTGLLYAVAWAFSRFDVSTDMPD